MPPSIENPHSFNLPAAIEQILSVMFADYGRVIIRKEFGYGLSGGRVIEVRPIKTDGIPELPVVVKTATISLIEKEWQAYQTYIRRRLPYVADVRGQPVLLPEIGWGGLRYSLMGGGTFEVVSLRDYCRSTELTGQDVGKVLDRLLRIMHQIWGYNHSLPEFPVQASYDRLLPVNLLIIQQSGQPPGPVHSLSPDNLPTMPLDPGDTVHVSGFAVDKVNLVTQTMTLNRPATTLESPAYYLRFKSLLAGELAAYPVNQIIDPLQGEVVETRLSRLHHEVQRVLGETFEPTASTIVLPAGNGMTLSNPLAVLPSVLNRTLDVKAAAIHGDFNFENILIEPETGAISLIDFAAAREDHVLHDLLRLETEVLTKLMPEILYQHDLPPASTLASFYHQLHAAAFLSGSDRPALPHPALEKPFIMLTTTRRAARKYFFDSDDPGEYYLGLFLYLVGALKFKNLDSVPEAPLPKQLAFWGAALVYRQLTELPAQTGLKTVLPAPFQAPHDVLQFVGREQELNRLRDLLTGSPGQAVCCLTGMGGIGKTSLAIRLAYQLREHFTDGILWANAANSEPLAILDSWAQAYGYNFTGLTDLASRAAALRGELAEKKILMVLDDVWSAAKVRPLLLGGSQGAVLITSRNKDLAMALEGQEFQLSVLTPVESRQLLTRIVGAERIQDEEQQVAELCEILGHLPLAIKIAARRLASRRRWQLANLVERLRNEKHRLAELKISDLEVRASFSVSWAAVDRTLRRIFALLAVFEGRRFRAPALAAVAGIDNFAAEDHLYNLATLSLVAEEGLEHYQQHPLLADFAREQLGEDEAAFRSMADYYLQYATEHRHNYVELEEEWGNLLAGMEAAYRREMWPETIGYADMLADAWFARARFSDMRQGYQWACEAANMLDDRSALAHGLMQWGRACIEQGDYREAEKRLAHSLELCRDLDDRPGIAQVQYYRGRIAIERADFDEAQRLLAQSQQIREKLGDVSGVAEILYQQANVQYEYRHIADAKMLARQTLEMQQTIGDKLGIIRTTGLLADIALKQDEPELAADYCRQALKLCEEIQEQGELAVILYILAEADRRQGELTSARAHAVRSLDLLLRMGDRKTQAWALWRLSVIDADLKDFALALEEGLQSLELQRALENEWGTVYVLMHLGDIYGNMDQPDQAQAMWSEALEQAEALQHPVTGQLRERLPMRG